MRNKKDSKSDTVKTEQIRSSTDTNGGFPEEGKSLFIQSFLHIGIAHCYYIDEHKYIIKYH